MWVRAVPGVVQYGVDPVGSPLRMSPMYAVRLSIGSVWQCGSDDGHVNPLLIIARGICFAGDSIMGWAMLLSLNCRGLTIAAGTGVLL